MSSKTNKSFITASATNLLIIRKKNIPLHKKFCIPDIDYIEVIKEAGKHL